MNNESYTFFDRTNRVIGEGTSDTYTDRIKLQNTFQKVLKI